MYVPVYFDWAPLERYIVVNFPDPNAHLTELLDHEISASWIGELLGVHRQTIGRARRAGRITRHAADRFTNRLNMHPLELWPHWLDDVELDPEEDLVCA